MWGFMILLFGMLFHTRSGKPKGKSRNHRKFYRQGLMTEELEALDALHDSIEIEEHYEKRYKK